MKKLLISFLLFSHTVYAQDVDLSSLKLPAGFHIEIYAHVPGAREMTLGPNQIVFVGTKEKGKVYAVIPQPTAMIVLPVATGLTLPNGVAYFNHDLYIAAVDKIYKIKNIKETLFKKPQLELITDKLPNSLHHGWRYIRFSPDGKLYIGIGAPCNTCLSTDKRYATILRMDPQGDHQEIYAYGVRNTVGFDWQPQTQQLWFTDNGSDNLGDNVPHDELNVATKMGQHFGYPFCHEKNIADPIYGKERSCADFTPPFLELTAHAAALGMKFYNGMMFPKKYAQQIFIARHGSWNRSNKVGYDVLWVDVKNKKSYTFITGWLQGEKVIGRPVDILEMPDGALLLSDDYADLIYRISYKDK